MSAFTQSPLNRGDVVSCNFPLAGAPGAPGPKARPALVLDRRLDPVQGEMVELAYGTSAVTSANRGLDLPVAGAAARAAAGVRRDTRFVLRRTLWVPAREPFLAPNAEGEVRLGRLPETLWAEFEALDALRRPARRCHPVVVIRRSRRRWLRRPKVSSATA